MNGSQPAPLLNEIHHPSDLAALSTTELARLAAEIRGEIIRVVSRNGGHLASNLGVVELSIVLHRVFQSPTDKIVWDVGHQCYTHKILTGRGPEFPTIRLRAGLSGFPKRSESEHDIVDTGHSSTSISAALGILTAQELRGVEGTVIAVIGDGSLTGGMAFEGLNHAGHLRKGLIIVLNDNHMSIGPNVGALSAYLSRITATALYQSIRERIDENVKRIPVFGMRIMDLIERGKRAVKAVFFKETIFSDLGFEYVGPIDGHNIGTMSSVFRAVKKIDKPVVVHVVTRKGMGYEAAEGDPTRYHGVGPFSVVDGKIEEKSAITFSDAFSGAIVERAARDPRVVAVTAAMSDGTGLSLFDHRYPERFFDVGITEQHAVTFAAGLAAGGLRPVVAIYSTFLQRAVDQIIHDVALPRLPVVLAVDRAGVVPGDGETHQGLYDLAFLRAVPGVTILAPATAAELALMLDFAVDSGAPAVIRYPKGACPDLPDGSEPLQRGRGRFFRRTAENTLLVTAGSLAGEAVKAADLLSRSGRPVDVYDLRFLSPLDEPYLLSVLSSYRSVLLLEEGTAVGGLGEYVGCLLKRSGVDLLYRHSAVPSGFSGRGTRAELLDECRLDAAGIVSAVSALEGRSAVGRR